MTFKNNDALKRGMANAIEKLKCEIVMNKMERMNGKRCYPCDGTGEGVDEFNGTMIIPGGCPRCKGTGREP